MIGKRWALGVLAVMVAAAGAHPVLAEDEKITPLEVYEMVNRAAAVIMNLPADQWKKAIDDPDGEFQMGKGACYVFVMVCEGEETAVVSTSYDKESIGAKGLMDLPGPGNDYPVRMVCAASNPDGQWVAYMYENPATRKVERKITFTVSVRGLDGGTYSLSAGIYDPEKTYTLALLNKGL